MFDPNDCHQSLSLMDELGIVDGFVVLQVEDGGSKVVQLLKKHSFD
jgi:hypothetical protein